MGLLGGTFDPIHLGHLAAASAAQQALHLDEVRFIPAARPPHRADSPRASEYHRLEMIRLAVSNKAGWEVSDLELRRHGPSYSWDTLAALHEQGWSPSQIFFITGADAFADIATWHRYPELLDAAHFVVVTRPGISLDSVRWRVPGLVPRMVSPEHLADAAPPRIIVIESTTPDVSSTEIRQRAARGESLDGMVPPAVAAYIAQHHLYRASTDASAASATPMTGTPPSGE
jgi:nicotinate-nucleotide adenylyltransferase